MSETPIRVGVFIPAFKWERMNLHSVTPEKHGVQLSAVELGDDLSSFDGILHKFTYQLVDGHEKDVAKIQEYVKNRPGFACIEPIENIKVFVDRLELQNFIKSHPLPDFLEYIEGYKVDSDFTPEKYGLNYPLMLKPISACGTDKSHSLQVIHNKEQLDNCDRSVDLLAFPFVPHNGVVFKCYALGDHFYMKSAKSLQLHSTESVKFDSQKPMPTAIAGDEVSDELKKKIEPSDDELRKSSEALRKMTGIELIGYDIIRRESDGKLCLVDFNYFPCFRGIEDVPGKFAEFIKYRVQQAKASTK